jgi:hypothetical protein
VRNWECCRSYRLRRIGNALYLPLRSRIAEVNANRQQVNVCAAPRKRFRRLRFEQANKNNRYLMGLKLTTPDPSSRLTVIFTTLNRPEAATRLVKSIRYYYPNMEIIVGDQSEPTSSMSLFYSYYNVLYIHLDGHCSVSEVRTACANAARTDFVVLVEDDFIFSGETDLSIPLLQLDFRYSWRHQGLPSGSPAPGRELSVLRSQARDVPHRSHRLPVAEIDHRWREDIL